MLSEANLDAVARLDAFARRHGRNTAALAIAWLAGHDVVASVIAGAMNPEQVRANASAADWTLTTSDMDEVNALAPPPPSDGRAADRR